MLLTTETTKGLKQIQKIFLLCPKVPYISQVGIKNAEDIPLFGKTQEKLWLFSQFALSLHSK
jgi:hypothetical protein